MNRKRKYGISTIARILFALVMIMGIAVGNVFAKYVTKEEGETEEARVAAWGIEINVTDSNLFGTRYIWDNESSSSIIKEGNDGTAIIVANDSSSYLVAPGATGSISFTISGSAEVASKVSIDISGTKDVLLKGTLTNNQTSAVSNVEYSPLVWTLNDGTSDIISGTLSDCLDKMKAPAENINPNDTINVTYKLSWSWPYENNISRLKSGSSIINIDQADTLWSLLTYDKKNDTNRAASYVDGYTFASSNDTSLNASLIFKIVVEQVD